MPLFAGETIQIPVGAPEEDLFDQFFRDFGFSSRVRGFQRPSANTIIRVKSVEPKGAVTIAEATKLKVNAPKTKAPQRMPGMAPQRGGPRGGARVEEEE